MPICALDQGIVFLSTNSIFLALRHALYLGGVPWDMAILTTLGMLWGRGLGPFNA